MDRNYGKEIDEIREEIQRLKSLVEHSVESNEPSGKESKVRAVRARQLRREADAHGWKGAINSYSTFSSNGNEYYTDLPSVSSDTLFELDNDISARVLSTFSHKQRLAILKAILEEPLSASEILDKLKMGTTGQVYHHINALLSADLITQDSDGKYAFKGHRVHAFLLILAGVRHVLDERYSKGDWSIHEEKKV